MEERRCCICNGIFTPSREHRKYCSTDCFVEGRRRWMHEYNLSPKHREAVKKWNAAHKEKRYATTRRWQHKNRKHLRELQKAQRARVRHKVLVHYGGDPPVCACCGENEEKFLGIDHINGGGSEHRRKLSSTSSHVFYAWLVRNKFPKGYQVLCHNCNMAKAIYGTCPHKTAPEQMV